MIPTLSPSTKTGAKLLLFLGLLIATGCSTVFGALNTQRSALRGTGDLGVTAYLDSTKDDQWQAHRVEIKAVLAALQGFMVEGGVQHLAYPKLVEAVKGLVPEDYKNIANLVLDAVQRTDLDVDVDTAIGEANVARINAVLEGVAAGLRLYRAEHRPTDDSDGAGAAEVSPATPPAGDMPPDEDMDVQPGDGDGE